MFTERPVVEARAVADLGREEWTRGVHTVRTRLLEQLDHVPRKLRADRWMLLAGYVGHALANRETLIQYGRAASLAPRPVFLAHLTDTAVALTTAPVSPDTAAHLHQHQNRRTP